MSSCCTRWFSRWKLVLLILWSFPRHWNPRWFHSNIYIVWYVGTRVDMSWAVMDLSTVKSWAMTDIRQTKMSNFLSPLIPISEFCVELSDGSCNEYSAHVIAEKLCCPVQRWPIDAPSTWCDGEHRITDAVEPLIFDRFRWRWVGLSCVPLLHYWKSWFVA